MSKYRDEEVSGFLLNSGYSLKQVIRVAKGLRSNQQEDNDEKDADYEMGRGAMPQGYYNRRNK